MVSVQLTDDAWHDLTALDGAAQKIVLKALKNLATDPHQYGEPLGKRMASDLTGFRKLVVGRNTYRILYLIHGGAGQDTLVVVWVIAKRADDHVYQLAQGRLDTMKQRAIASRLEQLVLDIWRG